MTTVQSPANMSTTSHSNPPQKTSHLKDKLITPLKQQAPPLPTSLIPYGLPSDNPRNHLLLPPRSLLLTGNTKYTGPTQPLSLCMAGLNLGSTTVTHSSPLSQNKPPPTQNQDLHQRQINFLLDANSYHPQSYLPSTSQPLQNSLASYLIKIVDPASNSEDSSLNNQVAKPMGNYSTCTTLTPTQYLLTTDFNFSLTSIPLPPRMTTKHSNMWLGQPQVLIVEHDQICRRILSTILELMGCRIEFACNGLKAVSRISRQNKSKKPFNFVLMDISMPNMDGFSATSLNQKFNLKTPIISMT
ncbi:hypothetical protein PCASD_19249 [Puccinia coronata f. sp. avenae]|uniref:Response regulatory domain-containing protein n=1 Tax=Puccinia coronata f. sp. avenae TaxID=200324 RepID=A0A2N5UA36_9BASI|nr:hypothetical protein PCASD_19249 [Puccinia coronata f. sp. avenae]